jgi:hypothetical protein
MPTLGEAPKGVMHVIPNLRIYKYNDFIVAAIDEDEADRLLMRYIENIEGVIRFLEIDSRGSSKEYVENNDKEIIDWKLFIEKIGKNISNGSVELKP